MTDTTNAADQLRAVVHAIHALKSPPPSGSQHYQSGWDTGLEAAIEAVKAVFEQTPTLAHARQVLGTTTGQPETEAPAADRTSVRDRIRRAVCEASGFTWLPDELMEPDEYGEHADAVLAVLPAPADRATVLREAAEVARQLGDDMGEIAAPGARLVADRLRRLAAEAQQPTPDVAEETTAEADARLVVAYNDGMGSARVYCVRCPRPDDVVYPLDINAVEDWDICPSCGRHCVDVARACTPTPAEETKRCARCREPIDLRGTEDAPLWVHRFGNQYCYPGLRASARPDRTPAP